MSVREKSRKGLGRLLYRAKRERCKGRRGNFKKKKEGCQRKSRKRLCEAKGNQRRKRDLRVF